MAARPSRWKRIALVVLVVGGALIALAYHFGLAALKTQVEKALGPQSEVGEIRIGLGAVEVLNLRLKGGRDWPAEDALRAKRIRIEPDIASLFSDHVRVSAIVVEGAYVSALRTASGRLRIVPSLLEAKGEKSSASPRLGIGRVELKDAAVDFFDASVARPPLRVRLEGLDATAENIELPELDSRVALNLEGRLKGVHSDGAISIKGWIVPASKESDIASRFRDVDLAALQPYLIKAADTGVRQGTLDMDMNSTVKDRQLRAPGTVTLKNLELDGGGGFMGHARSAAVNVLKDKQDRIVVKFLLEGNMDDPRFSLNESFAARFGAGLADALGVSVEGVARGASSLGNAVKSLFGGK